MKWLLILIAAPFASFGEEPGNGHRRSADRPTRSALIGLAGAALGVEREDVNGQRDLAASFLTATRTISPGVALSDFHTAQSLPDSKRPVATRREALSRRSVLETSICRRDYRCDGRWQIAYVARDDASFSLEGLRQAFLRPRFALWVGRKSCPLAHPLAPFIADADRVETAFAAHALAARIADNGAVTTVAIDERLLTPAGAYSARRHRRIDEPGDRTRWHFSARQEVVFPMAGSLEPNR